MNDKLQVKETPAPSSMLEIIGNLVAQPGKVDVEALHRLLDFQERLEKRNAEQEYIVAMSALQEELPQIEKGGKIFAKDKVTVKAKYAKLEDIDTLIRPILAKHGFSFSFNEEEAKETMRRFSAKLSHRAGHSETKFITLPIDKNEYRSAIQDSGSTASYARRYLIQMHLNMVTKDEDDDGQGAMEFISQEQVRELETGIQDTGTKKEAFLKLIAGVETIEEIPARDFRRCMNAIEEKRRTQRK